MSATTTAPTAADYARIFEAECRVRYPAVEDFEVRMGFALDRERLEDAARVLACPFKANPPNWQHGRVLYALLRRYVADHATERPVRVVDVGTAKGFSALCLQWALNDAGVTGQVTSVDVIEPAAAVRRNTVAELDGYLSLSKTLAPWPESAAIRFEWSTSAVVLRRFTRVHVCYLDGKHTYDAVASDIQLLADRQEPGDVVMWDDVQIDGVARAVAGAAAYTVEYLDILPHRRYAIGVKRG